MTKVKQPSTDTSSSLAGEDDDIYRIRVVHIFQSPSSTIEPAFGFYGLGLEIIGFARESKKKVSQTLEFPIAGGATKQDLSKLESVIGPYIVRVRSMLTLSSSNSPFNASETEVVQQVQDVQINDTIAYVGMKEICKNNFASSRDIYEKLHQTISTTSIDRPYIIRFRRSNLAQATAKIIPFARRSDVQAAQMERFKALQEREKEVSRSDHLRNQWALHQLNWKTERRLYSHLIGDLLIQAYADVMRDGKWQAYEFEKRLWYYNSETMRLIAEHPIRRHISTEQLITMTRLRYRIIVNRVKRAGRRFLLVCRTIKAVNSKLVDTYFETAFEKALRRKEKKAVLLPKETEAKRLKDPEENIEAVLPDKDKAYHVESLDKEKAPSALVGPENNCKQVVKEDEVHVLPKCTGATENNKSDADDNWKEKLTLLKTNLQVKRTSPGKRQRSKATQYDFPKSPTRNKGVQSWTELPSISTESQTEIETIKISASKESLTTSTQTIEKHTNNSSTTLPSVYSVAGLPGYVPIRPVTIYPENPYPAEHFVPYSVPTHQPEYFSRRYPTQTTKTSYSSELPYIYQKQP